MRCSLAALALLAACDRPQPLVICHNGNCAGGFDTRRDDTPEALRESLAEAWHGRTAIDGVELDTLWHRPTTTCLFEHGPGLSLPPDTVAEAGTIVAEHLAGPDVAWNGATFHVFIELKPYVAERADRHTTAERERHADCVLDLHDQLIAAAAAGGHRLEVVFESRDPALLATLESRPRWPGRGGDDVVVRVAGEPEVLLDPVVTGAATSRYPMSLDVFLYPLDGTTDGQLTTLRSLDLELALWSYAFTPSLTATIRRDEPTYVLTGEAETLRRWLDN